MPLQNASAAEVVRVVNSLYTQQRQERPKAAPPVEGRRRRSLQQRAHRRRPDRSGCASRRWLRHLDTPLEQRRRHAGALPALRRCREDRAQAEGTDHAASPAAAGAGGGAGAQAQSASGGGEERDASGRTPQTNALVITAPPKIMRSLMSIVDKLDIRRPQVLVEAIIVDVNVDKNAELGVNWAVFDKSDGTECPGRRVRAARSAARASSTWPRPSQNPTAATTTLLHRHDVRHRAHRRHRRELRRHAARDPRRLQHQHHRDALDGDDGQPGSGAQGRAGSAVRHRLSTPTPAPRRQRHRQSRSRRSSARKSAPSSRSRRRSRRKATPCVLKLSIESSSHRAKPGRCGQTSSPTSAPSPPTCSSRTAASWCSAA